LTDPPVIADVRVRILSAPLEEPVEASFGTLTARSSALVEIESTAGLVGVGESWINFPPWAGAERRATIEQGVAPLLRGLPVAPVAALHARLVSALEPLGRQWGAPGPIMQAISGADQALWDLLGKSRGVSAAELLGARRRDRVPVYASGLGPGDVGEQVRRCLADGFTAAKLRVGFGRARDEATLRSARAAGGDMELMVDANQGWTLEEALAMAPVLRDCRVSWVEEPLRGGDLAELATFRSRSGLRVAAGENLYGFAGFQPVLAGDAVDVLQPDVSKVGGLSEALAICRAAGERGHTVAPHLYGGAVAYAATLQLAACSPAVRIVELDVRPNPLRDTLPVERPVVRDGVAEIPAGPGLGVTLDPEALERFAAAGR
jgi:L-alanine-DL-glutamate epimerase-like enolase superfamily enzyme